MTKYQKIDSRDVCLVFGDVVKMTTKSGLVEVYGGEIRDVARDVARALRDHNEMVERITYLEKVISAINKGHTPGTGVEKVTFSPGGGYGGRSVNVIAGIGEIPTRFVAVGDSGIKIKVERTVSMYGGGHGEGAARPCEDWDIKIFNGDGHTYFDNYGEIFTLLK